MQLETRNATLEDLASLLTEQQAAKHDVVVPASAVTAQGARLVIDGAGDMVPHPTDGLAAAPGIFTPTATCDEGLAAKLGIPSAYLKRLRAGRADLYDANVNGWLHGWPAEGVGADARKFLVRCFKGTDNSIGVARAFLSDGFGIIDNLDVLTAALEGVQASGAEVQVVGCDLSERRMSIKVAAPGIMAYAPRLLAGYRNPFDAGEVRVGGDGGWDAARLAAAARLHGGNDYPPGQEPIVFAGFVIGNSEVGDGAFVVTPRIVVKWCRNGATITADALRRVHLGSRMDEGVVKWTDDTMRKNLALVAAQARDAVATFLDPAYVQRVVDGIEAKAGVPVTNPETTVKAVGKQLGFAPERTEAVLRHFIMGGQATAGGVFNAVTSVAQTIADPDEARQVEEAGLQALALAAS